MTTPEEQRHINNGLKWSARLAALSFWVILAPVIIGVVLALICGGVLLFNH